VGGGETQARLLAEGLISNGHSVIVITRRSGSALRQYENYGGVSVYRLGPVGSGQLKKWGLLLSSLPALVRLRDRYDLIFVSGYRIIGVNAVLVGKLFRKPVVLKADSQGEMSGEFFESGLKKFGLARSSLPFRFFLRFRNVILKKADAFSAISPEIVSEWTSKGVPLNKIHLIPNAVDTTRFTPANTEQKSFLREKFHLPHAAFIAIYTGRLVTYKGLPLLLRVWNEIRCNYKKALLLLAGTGGLDIHNCEAQLHDYVTSTGLEKNVWFLGSVQNIPEYLQSADLFVFPTENDAFPSSLIEAMSCGLPIVTTPVGAIKTIITHQETGLIVQPGNHQQLYEALVAILSDEKLASRMGQVGRHIVEERYSAGNTVGKYLSLFESTFKPG
jgi:glycosyltransferase involved in cell wall biosynthesis